MEQSKEKTKEKKSFKSLLKSFFCGERKSRIIPALLISLAIPLIIFISVPLENYTGNIGEMRFSFTDILGRAVLCGLGIMAILFVILFVLPNTAYLVFRGLFIAVGLLLFLQANFLNFGVTSLAGDEATTTIDMAGMGVVVLDTIIWIVILGGITTLSVFQKKLPIVKMICLVLSLVILLPTCLTTALCVATTDFSKGSAFEEMKKEEPNYVPTFLTTENMDRLATDRNIVVFIIDRLDNKKYMTDSNGEIIAKYKKYFDDWGGFTHFDDNISLYGRTYPSLAYILSRKEFHPEENNRKEYFKDAYNNNQTLSKLNQLDYTVNVYTDTYYGYYDAYYMPEYIDNLQTASEESLYRETTQKHNLFRSNMMMSMYRYLPFVFKDTVGGISSTSLNKYVVYKSDELTHPEASTDLKANHQAITKQPFTFNDKSDKQFTFIHLSGAHDVIYNETWGKAKGKDKKDVDISIVHSLNILDAYIKQMKELGVYDNSTIIVTGDHGFANDNFAPLTNTKLTSLFVKHSTSKEGALKTNSAPVCHADLWATIFESENIEYDKAVFGESMFNIAENAQRTRTYVWHKQATTKTSFYEYTYTINGSAKDFDNWTSVGEPKRHFGELYD